MKKRTLRLNTWMGLFLIVLMSLVACGEKVSDKEIIELEKKHQAKTGGEGKFSTKDAKELSTQLIAAYEKFAKANPKDEKTPEYVFKAAELARYYIHDFNKAQSFYQNLHDNHKNHKRSADALFNLAFMYNNELKDVSKAKQYYEQFISLYPKHTLVESAEFELKNLGKPDPQILEEIRKVDSTATDSSTEETAAIN